MGWVHTAGRMSGLLCSFFKGSFRKRGGGGLKHNASFKWKRCSESLILNKCQEKGQGRKVTWKWRRGAQMPGGLWFFYLNPVLIASFCFPRMISRDCPDAAAARGDQTTPRCHRIRFSGWSVPTGADFLGGTTSSPPGEKILLLHTLPFEAGKASRLMCDWFPW